MILIYLLLAAIALGSAWPLIRAVRNRSADRVVFRGGLILVLGILVDVALIVFLNYYLSFLWFTEVQDQAQRFWQAFIIVWKLFGLLFVAGFFVATASLAAAIASTVDWSAPERKWKNISTVAFGSVTYGIIAGLILGTIGAQMDWTTYLLYLYHEPGGALDPVFGRPLSFYLFELPFYESLMGFGFLLIIFCVPAVLLVSRAKNRYSLGRSGDLVLSSEIGFIVAGTLLYLGLLCLLWRVQLVYAPSGGHTGNIHGIDYLRHSISDPALKIIAWISFLLSAVVLGVSFFRRQFMTRTLIGSGATLVTSFVVYMVVLFFFNLTVSNANHLEKNRPYVQYTMEMTRAAFNIDAEGIELREFPIVDTMSAADLQANTATLDAARIWDYSVFDQRITQTQRVKPYYDFTDVDLDRYIDEDGQIHPVMISLRNLDISQLPASAGQSWVNTRLRFTHGYGAVVSPVNRFVGNGEPIYYAGDLDGSTQVPWLNLEEPRIYFGDNFGDAVFVNANGIDEFDRPLDTQDLTNRYSCDGGVVLSNPLRKAAAVWETGLMQILFSEYFSDETRMLIHRNVSERIAEVVPFLTADSDWYVVIHEGRLVAVQDLYTTSNHYPFAEQIGDVRYIRGAVKATVDLCHGVVNLYAFDESDPVLAAYQAAFPDLIQSRSEMPESLQAHARYPEGLFLHQYAAYAAYHVTDVERFYNSSDVWSAPTEYSRGREVSMAARYIVAELPPVALEEGSDALELAPTSPEFMLTRPYVFKFGGSASQSRPRMTGWLTGLSDGDNYGRLVAYRFPGDTHVDGPAHIEQRIAQHDPFVSSFRDWTRGEATWFRGNLIILPLVSGQLVAFEPIYTEARPGAIPELKRVVSVQLRPGSDDSTKIVWGNTYEESRQALLGFARSVDLLQDGEGENLSDGELLELVYERLVTYGNLSGDGQFGAAGAELEAALNALRDRVGSDEEE